MGIKFDWSTIKKKKKKKANCKATFSKQSIAVKWMTWQSIQLMELTASQQHSKVAATTSIKSASTITEPTPSWRAATDRYR